MKNRLFKTMLFWGLMGLGVFLGRWIIVRIFNHEPFTEEDFVGFIIVVSIVILPSLVLEFIKIRKEKECNKN